ncbi:response regulator transcription factor [Parahaliea mediterranea]|uniref:response regulator transcription factor n=1 Tax=Parahaliea mediterranea TaxID=651086 RepID=UPI000E2F2A79|nr:response regulator transcription factor [Parahaliea mediterranea]
MLAPTEKHYPFRIAIIESNEGKAENNPGIIESDSDTAESGSDTAESDVEKAESHLSQTDRLAQWLTPFGYETIPFDNRASFLQSDHHLTIDAILVDWEVSDEKSTEFIQTLRQQLGFSGAILVISDQEDELDLVKALVSGADDYLEKPLKKAEFLARIMATMRRRSKHPTGLIQLGPIQIDPENKTVKVNGLRVELTSTEFLLIECFGRHAGALLSRQYLLGEVWNIFNCISTRTVDIYIGRLRKKLDLGPATGYVIRSVYRNGYRLERIEEGDSKE